jgi:beta-lactamase class A
MRIKFKRYIAIIAIVCAAAQLAACSSGQGARVSGKENASLADVTGKPDPEETAETGETAEAAQTPPLLREGEGTSPQKQAQPPSPSFEISAAEALQTGAPAEFVGLKEQIDGLLEGDYPDCVWDVWVESLGSGESISCFNGEEPAPMASASLIKLFIMAAVYEQIELGNIKEEDVQADLRSMITVSDNTASNELTSLLGGGDAEDGIKAVNEYAAGIGCKDTYMNRLMLVENGMQNYTTASDCATILRMIYNGECVSRESSEKMLGLLKAQQRTGKIPAGVPDDVETANKTGELTGISECDVAIVFAETGDYILCALSEPSDNSAAARKIINISKAVYSYMTGTN